MTTKETKDSLGDRMKSYEKKFSNTLDDKFIIVRVDGKAFHTYTRPLKKLRAIHGLTL
jgi:tRNA(His) 5'-end guanylyltransferase